MSENPQETPTSTQPKVNWLKRIVTGLGIIAALVVGVMILNMAREITRTWEFTSGVPGFAAVPTQVDEQGNVIDQGLPVDLIQDDNSELEWDGKSRVNILLMGLDINDYRAGYGPPKTDSMVVITIDPITLQAGILSIPRDMWVNVPGYGYNRVNTAYQWGEAGAYPDGGGPGLAMKTVEEFLGIDIQYYAQIDFDAFVQFIDRIGGVTVLVDEPITLSLMYSLKKVTLKPGIHTLNGELALAYARNRKTDGGDFDRSQRTQAVILAIRDRLLKPDVQARVIADAAEIYAALSGGVRTNMDFNDILRFGWMAKDVPLDNIQQGVMTPEQGYVTLETSPDGAQILKPITAKIRQLRDDMFSGSASAAAFVDEAQRSPEELMKLEAARVGIYNGSPTPGMAGLTQDYFLTLGMNIVDAGNSEDQPAYTIIYDYTGNPYTIKYLVALMNIQTNRIRFEFDPNSPVDIAIIIGPEWTVPSSQ